jgi:hypothetical protein
LGFFNGSAMAITEALRIGISYAFSGILRPMPVHPEPEDSFFHLRTIKIFFDFFEHRLISIPA